MTPRQREFLIKLASLMEEYNADFGYTINDDGIHIGADGSECFAGFLIEPVQELRDAACK